MPVKYRHYIGRIEPSIHPSSNFFVINGAVETLAWKSYRRETITAVVALRFQFFFFFFFSNPLLLMRLCGFEEEGIDTNSSSESFSRIHMGCSRYQVDRLFFEDPFLSNKN